MATRGRPSPLSYVRERPIQNMATRPEQLDQRHVVPLGIPGLDRRLDGGIRAGSSLLVIGSFGSGYREFLKTAAVIHGNWQAESGLFDLEYDWQTDSLHRPSEVRYMAITESESRLHRSLANVADSEWVRPAIEHLTCSNLADEYATLGPVKPSSSVHMEYKYEDGSVGDAAEFQQFFRAFGQEIVESMSDELVLVDAISDFLPVSRKYLDWTDLYFISQTLNYIVSASDSVLIAAADADILDQREQALLRRTFDNVLDFEWFGEGTQRRRAMAVTKFPRFWRETGSEDRVLFDVELDRGYFGISDVKKIPPSSL